MSTHFGNGNDLAGHIFGKTLDIELGLRGNACFELFDAMSLTGERI